MWLSLPQVDQRYSSLPCIGNNCCWTRCLYSRNKALFFHDCRSLLLNFLYRRRVGLEAFLHFQLLGTRVAAWVTTMHWETQNSQKTGSLSFSGTGVFQSMTDFETQDFSYKMEGGWKYYLWNKQQITKGNKSQVKSEALWYCWVS
jgi:hypothetical protein